jgi:tRNA-2-methylthio-N6-dimethylallyladenosine synthase
VPYKNNFIFKYSPRPGTVAFDRLADDVPDEVKRARNNALLALQNTVSAKVHERWVGRTVSVFLEDIRERSAPSMPINGQVDLSVAGRSMTTHAGATPSRQIIGRTPGDLIVALPAPDDAQSMLGNVRLARIVGSKPLLLDGMFAVT